MSRKTDSTETEAQRDSRLAWWRKARFGMFIHWGLYAVPAGEWRGEQKKKDLWAEWIMQRARIPVVEYETLANRFNPVKFNAEEWVQTAKGAGMKYIVITAKHCDGFAMYHSRASRFNIVDATPFKRDPLAELVTACKKHNMKLGYYYSHCWDWHEPDSSGIPNDWDFGPVQERDFSTYFRRKSLPQVEELLSEYEPDILWFDVPDLSPEWSQTFLETIRRRASDCIVNDRIGNKLGDYATPERFIPRGGTDGDFEVCTVTNGHWGYDKNDHNWKSPQTIIHYLADIASKGGNLLLNVGPTAEGTFPPEAVRLLGKVGEWMQVNGESIYGTQAGPLAHVPWGVCTRNENKLFLHVFERPPDNVLIVPGLLSNVTRAHLLADSTRQGLGLERMGELDWSVTLPRDHADPNDTVVVLQCDGIPAVDPTPVLFHYGSTTFYAAHAIVHGKEAKYLPQGFGRPEYDCIGQWTSSEDWVEWKIRPLGTGRYDVSIVFGAAPECNGNKFLLELAGTKIECSVESTGKYEKFVTLQLGSVAVVRTGTVSLSIRPTSLNGGSGLCDLHAVICSRNE